MYTEEVEKQFRHSEAERNLYTEKFDRLCELASRNPRIFELRIVLLGFLGWIYLGFLVILGLVAILFSGSAFFIVLGVMLLASITVSLRTPKYSQIRGYQLKRKEFQSIYQELADIAKRFGTNPVDAVYVVHDADALAAERPRFGILGGFRRHMVIGLPLLLCLSRDEMRSVFSHEMGHFSGKHGQICHRLYRTRIAWSMLRQKANSKGRSINNALIVPFANWYLLYLDIHEAVLRRQQEIEADLRAKEVSEKAGGFALLRAQVLYTKLNVCMDDIYDLAKRDSEPPSQYSELLVQGLRKPLPVDKLEARFRYELSREPSPRSSHLPLRQRVECFGIEVDRDIDVDCLNQPLSTTSSDFYLGDRKQEVLDAISKLWQENYSAWWQETHEHYGLLSQQLADSRSETKTTVDDWLHEAYLVGELEGYEAALEYYEEAQKQWPDNDEVIARHGLTLLAMHRSEGVPMIERAMQMNPKHLKIGCERLAEHYREAGEYQLHKEIDERYKRLQVAKEIAYDEGRFHVQGDQYVPHRLTSAQIDKIVKGLAGVEGLAELYVVRKVLEKSGLGDKLIIVAVPDRKYYRWKVIRNKSEADIQHRVWNALSLPDEAVVFGRNSNTPLVSLVKDVPNSRLIP